MSALKRGKSIVCFQCVKIWFQIGINFADDGEAREAFEIIKEKAAKRASGQNRKPQNGLTVLPKTGNERYNPSMNTPLASSPGINHRPMGNHNSNLSSSHTSIDSGVSESIGGQKPRSNTKSKVKGKLKTLSVS